MNSNYFDLEKKKILILFDKKKFNKVLKLGSKVIKKNSKDYELLYALGFSAINLHNYIDAEKFFKKILIIKKTAYLFYVYGNIQSKLKNHHKASDAFEKALSLEPNFSEAYNNLANAKKLVNDINGAISNYQKAIEKKKDNLTAYFNLAVLYKENRKYFESKEIYEKILELDKKNLAAIHDIGTIESILGNFDHARKYFINAVKQNNKNFKSYRNYIEITKINKENLIFNKLKNISFENETDESKIDIFYSLSKAYFDQEEIKVAFHYLEKAKKIKQKFSKFSIKREKKRFENLKKYFNDFNNIKIKHTEKLKNIPIFVLGMPRSGTTLIEQILSTNSKIHGAGELYFLPKIIEQTYIKGNMSYESIIFKIRSYYAKEINKISNKEFIVDKLPLNFRWIGFIIKAFPEAKIIHLKRNAMAVCWSNYKINFRDTGMEFTLTQKDVANYYSLYNDLMMYWENKFLKNIIHIEYEDFVKDYENNSKKIFKNLNLDCENSFKSYNKINRPVETASLYQVRGKIIKNSSDQWKKYRVYLNKIEELLNSKKISY